MKFKLGLILVLMFMIGGRVVLAAPSCGLKGDIQARIADCNQATDHLKLVFNSEPTEAWLDVANSTVYLSKVGESNAMSWDAASKFCKELTKNSAVPQQKNKSWKMPSYKTFPADILSEGFTELKRPSSDFDEVRFWMAETFMHPSGKRWGYYYSSQGDVQSWFTDAGDLIYRGICSLDLR